MSSMDPFDVGIEELRATRSSHKWRMHDADILPAFVAEMDVRLAPAVQRALRGAVDASDTGYATHSGELHEACAAFQQQRFGLDIAADSVRTVSDVMSGVLEVLRLLTDRGDAVIVTPPVYPPFFRHIEEAGCTAVEAPLVRDGDSYRIDVDSIDSAMTHGGRVLLLCSPHNPTGRVFRRGELQAVLDVAERHDAWILSDEIHAPLVLPGQEHTPLLALERAAERTFAFVSASKGWNIPGLKCAQLLVASQRTRAVAKRLPEAVQYRASIFGVVASTAAYRDSPEWLDSVVASLQAKHLLFHSLLRRQVPMVRVTPAEATYLAWIDCSALGMEDPAALFLERGRVALDSGPRYGRGGAGFARATIAAADATLDQIVARMAAAVAALNKD